MSVMYIVAKYVVEKKYVYLYSKKVEETLSVSIVRSVIFGGFFFFLDEEWSKVEERVTELRTVKLQKKPVHYFA